jgi:hypothetical protein
MCELVSDSVKVADESLRVLPFLYLSVVPGEVVAEVDVDGSISIESDQRSFSIMENVQGLRVDSEHFSDRVEDLRDESSQRVVVGRDESCACSERVD